MPRSTEATERAGAPLSVDEPWLALRDEPVFEPDWPLVDPHHHLWHRPGWPYMLEELAADVATGHRVLATVLVECRAMYRPDGPQAMRPVGETEHAAACGMRSDAHDPGGPRLCAGIVGHADLRLGAAVQPVLEAHIEAGAGRFRGIRYSTAWDADPQVLNPELGSAAGLLQDRRFREGFARLAPLGLSFDAWVYHPQLDEVVQLARAFPHTCIVLDHAGGPIGIGSYAQRRDEVYRQWRSSISELARCDNVRVKLGGLAMRISGAGFHRLAQPPSSTTLADALRPFVGVCIEAFGPQRCMFESNFPVEKASSGYRILWNAFKRLAGEYTVGEREALLASTAARTYRLDLE